MYWYIHGNITNNYPDSYSYIKANSRIQIEQLTICSISEVLTAFHRQTKVRTSGSSVTSFRSFSGSSAISSSKRYTNVFCIHNSIDWLYLMDLFEFFANQQLSAFIWWPKSFVITSFYYTSMRDVTGIILLQDPRACLQTFRVGGVKTDIISRCCTTLQAATYVGMHG